MRAIILLFLFNLWLIECENPKKKSDLEKLGFKGKVKSVETIYYYAVEKSGKITKGDTSTKAFYLFNKQGNLQEKLTDFYYGSQYKTKYVYDSQNNLIQNYIYDSYGDLDKKIIYKNDNKGNKIEELIYDENDSLIKKYTYVYDLRGNLKKEFEYNPQGLKSKKTYKYDLKGNLKKEKFYRSNGELDGKYIYKYDSQGKVIAKYWFTTKVWLTLKLTYKNTYKYNSQGDLIEEILYKNDGSIENKRSYEYEYDNQGNWIRAIEYDTKEKPQYIIIRKIEYYN